MRGRSLLAVDPSLACTGWVEVDYENGSLRAVGAIVTRKAARKRRLRQADDDVARCLAITVRLRSRIAAAGLVLVEVPSAGAQGARANRAMGLVTGVMASLTTGLPHVQWWQAGDVREILCGKRSAPKDAPWSQVIARWPKLHEVAEAAGVTTKPEMEAVLDAAALALAWERRP